MYSARIGTQTKVEKSNLIFKEGASIVLKCPSIIKPYCLKNGRGLPDHLFDEHTLIIEGATVFDEGLYICNGKIDERRLILCQMNVYVAGK